MSSLDVVPAAPEIKAMIDNAFSKAPISLIYKPTEKQASETNRFIVQSPSYYNLQAFITLALRLPPTVERFNADYPKDQLEDMNLLDPEAHTDIRNVMVNINNHASDFQRNSMGKFLTVTNGIIAYCKESNKYIGGPGLLKDQLAILSAMDEGDWTAETKRASFMAQGILRSLAKGAIDKQKACEDLVKDLTLYHGQTVADKVPVDKLYKNFISPGPGPDIKPYSEQLEGQLAALRIEATQLATDYQNEKDNYNYYVVASSTTVTYAWLFPFGTIAAAAVAGVNGTKAVAAKAAYEAKAADIRANNTKQHNLTRCIDLVTNITCEMAGIARTIQQAIDALSAMQSMFARMASDLTEISTYFGKMSSTVQEDNWFMRAMANVDLDLSIAHWGNVEALAMSFAAHAPIEWRDSP